MQRVNETTRELMFPRTRRVRTFKFICNKTPESSRANPVRFLPSTNFVTLVPKPGKEAGTPLPSCHSDRHLRMSSSRSRDSTKNITSADGHEGRPGEEILCPRPEPAGGPRAVPELDGPGGSGRGIPAPAPPTHMPVQKMGPQDDPEAFLDLFEKTAAACGWPQRLASAPHPPANRGGAVGGAAAASPEPPGLRRPETSHPPAGRPEPRAAPPALPFAGAGGERPALRDGSPAPGRLPQMAVGRGSRPIIDRWCWSSLLRAPRPRSGSSATARRRWTWPSNSPRTRWWRATGLANPTSVSLSLPLLFPPFFSQVPCRRGSRAQPDGEEDRHRSRRPESPRQGGGVSQPELRAFPFLRGLHANSLSHFPPLGWRGSLGRPVGVAGTRATSSIGVQ